MQTENQIALLEQNKSTLTELILVNLPKGSSREDAELLVLQEISNVQLIFSLNPALSNCDGLSVLLAVKQCICDKLTLAPSAGLVYLYPGKIAVGVDPKTNQKLYKDVLVYEPTMEGRISMSYGSGAILDHKRPVCTYDSENKVDSVSVELLVPSYGSPRWEKITFGKVDFERWKQKSAAKFNGTANGNYTSWNKGIDPEFAATKALKHALKKRGSNKNVVRFQQEIPMNVLASPQEPESVRVFSEPIKQIEMPNPENL